MQQVKCVTAPGKEYAWLVVVTIIILLMTIVISMIQ